MFCLAHKKDSASCQSMLSGENRHYLLWKLHVLLIIYLTHCYDFNFDGVVRSHHRIPSCSVLECKLYESRTIFLDKGKGWKKRGWQPQLFSFSMIHRALFEPVAIWWHEKYQKHIQGMRGRITVPSIRLAIDHLLQRVVLNL